MKLALGTVQFGLNYGIANTAGRMPLPEAAAIVRTAEAHGITTLDTAVGYGDSEARLGEIGVSTWDVVTKLPACPAGCADIGAWVVSTARSSLDRLGCPQLHGLMLHRPGQLLEPGGEDLFAALQQVKADGLARKIGISVYEPAELDVMTARFDIDIVQLPFNVLDDRFARTGWLARLAARGIEVHTRSAFLQGLLLMSPEHRPATFARWHQRWRLYDDWVRSAGVTRLEACLRTALAPAEITRVVVGVDSVAHLTDILRAAEGSVLPPPASLASDDRDLINPANWPSLE